MKKTKPIIIPFAGGKGGVGKTFISANIAIALAEMGHPTIAVDLDLGGSNLHTMLGLVNQYPGVGDFLKARSGMLEDMLVPTSTNNLRFIPGDGLSPFMANIPYAQKRRLISNIKRLPAEYIILDLGSGTAFNTLDFFKMSKNGFIIYTMEHTSIMNMLGFLKNFLLRMVERSFSRNAAVREVMRSMYKQSMNDMQMNIENVKAEISAVDQDAGETVLSLCSEYRPRLVLNMGRRPDEAKEAQKISNNVEKVLSLEIDHFGFVFDDTDVSEAIRRKAPFLPNCRNNLAAINILRTAERIVKFGDGPINDSASLLLEHTGRVYGKYMDAQTRAQNAHANVRPQRRTKIPIQHHEEVQPVV